MNSPCTSTVENVPLRTQRRRKRKLTKNGYFSELMGSIRARCKRLDIELTIDTEWLIQEYMIQSGRCAVTGIPFRFPVGSHAPFSPSVDRLDGSLGYTRENCQLVIYMYNTAKNMFDHRDVVTMARAIAEREACYS